MAIATLVVDLVLKTGKLGAQVANALQPVGKSLTKFGLTASAAISAPLLGVTAIVGKMASDFDKEMRNVNATLLLSEEEFEDLRQKVLELSLTTRASSADVARSLLMIVHAGVDAADTFELLDVASHAAGAGLTTTEQTTKLLIATMQAYGMTVADTQEIIDRFIFASQRGAGTFEELTDSVGQILPMAAAAGIGIEEVTGALATLRKGGLDASTAAVSLTRAIQKILDPTGAMEQVFAAAGYESGLLALEELGLVGVIRLLNDAADGNVDKIINMTGLIQAWRGMIILAKDDATGLEQAIEGMGEGFEGAMERARVEQYKSFTAQLSRLKSALEVVGITLAEDVLPFLTALVKQLVPIVREFARMDDKTKKIILVLVGIGIALGPVLLLLGALISAIGTIGTVVGAALTPVGLVIMGIVAAVGALGAAWTTNFGGIQDKAKELWAELQPIFEDIKAVVLSVVAVFREVAGPIIMEAIASIMETLAKLGLDNEAVWNAIKVVVKTVAIAIGLIVMGLAILITGAITAIARALEVGAAAFKKFTDGVKKVLDSIKVVIEGWRDLIGGILTGDVERILDGSRAIFEGWFGFLEGIMNALGGLIQATFGAGLATVTGFVEGVLGLFQGLYDNLVGHSVIPDLVKKVNLEMGKLSPTLGGLGGMLEMGGVPGAVPGGFAGQLVIVNNWDASISAKDRVELAAMMEDTTYRALGETYGG